MLKDLHELHAKYYKRLLYYKGMPCILDERGSNQMLSGFFSVRRICKEMPTDASIWPIKKWLFFHYFCRFLGRSQRWPLFFFWRDSAKISDVTLDLSCFWLILGGTWRFLLFFWIGLFDSFFVKNEILNWTKIHIFHPYSSSHSRRHVRILRVPEFWSWTQGTEGGLNFIHPSYKQLQVQVNLVYSVTLVSTTVCLVETELQKNIANTISKQILESKSQEISRR